MSWYEKIIWAVEKIGFPIVISLILLYIIHFDLGAIVKNLEDIKIILNNRFQTSKEYRHESNEEQRTLENYIRFNNDGNRIDTGCY